MTANPGKPTPRDPRALVYGVLDLVFATAYGFMVCLVIPNRHLGASVVLWGMVAVCGGLGVATLLRRRSSWTVAVMLCVLQLAITAVVLALIVISSAYLAGIYGAYGKGASVMALVVAALVIQLVGLLPAFQLKYLLTRAGRIAFGRPTP